MKFDTVKFASDISIDGHKVSLDKTGDTLNAVVITKGDVIIARVVMRSYSMFIEKPSDPKRTNKHRLHGEVLGASYDKTFDDAHAAEMELLTINRNLMDEASHNLKIEEVDVIDDRDFDDLPF